MSLHPYFLILILAWGWVDDLCISSILPAGSTGVVDCEDNDYLPPARINAQKMKAQPALPPPGAAVGLNPGALPPCSRPARARKVNGFLLAALDPLYAFMSLQP